MLQGILRLRPSITRRQSPWDHVELMWLEFLQTFSSHPEGQALLIKETELMEIVIALTGSSKENNRMEAIMVLRNLAFYPQNRPRLLSSGMFVACGQSFFLY